MVVDGKALAAEMLVETKKRAEALVSFGVPTLAIITCEPNFETRKYLALKERKAAAAGVIVVVHEMSSAATTAELIAAVDAAVSTAHGIVVQLPLPAHIDREAVLAAVPPTHDPDGFAYGKNDTACESPVVLAIATIFAHHEIDVVGRRVVVVGEGRLVGAPAAHYFKEAGAEVVVVTSTTHDVASVTRTADVLVTGAGRPGLITPEMVKVGVVVLDAGTSEDGGVLVGDVHPSVAEKASLFTPVPGGIGPLTVAALLANTVTLAGRSWQKRG
ncbi:bifunctional 5,10-methylenetetrahydrofolate dehydrogenase/5,10-methenyltetrahydrofolate cyclohydrolase [Patescibacteria group bacterium]|nr:bifunctional 5,10-methylenetetrahydrofolate dehydrogenase/5,10-methenyltetrahydrofolate cyclohydrolase [Patescibacteria group bacterium]